LISDHVTTQLMYVVFCSMSVRVRKAITGMVHTA